MPAKPSDDARQVRCPFYDVLDHLRGKAKCSGEFLDHLKKAQVEFLLAVRSVIDQRVEQLSHPAKGKPRAQRIKVTEEE